MRILLDCDGVLADFVGSMSDTVYRVTGERHTLDEVGGYDILSSWGMDWYRREIEELTGERHWCSFIGILPGAADAVRKLRDLGHDVHVVTTDYNHSVTWVSERRRWLERYFGFTKNQVHFTSAKHLIRGDVLVDDNHHNVRDWLECAWNPLYIIPDNTYVVHPLHVRVRCGRGLLWDAPYNRGPDIDEEAGAYDYQRVYGWDDVFRILEEMR